VLSRRLRSAFFNRTRWFVTTIALQKELCAFASAKATHCTSIPSQLICLQSKRLKLDGKVYRSGLTTGPFILWVSFLLNFDLGTWIFVRAEQSTKNQVQSSIKLVVASAACNHYAESAWYHGLS
jgi:hypothetical protein